MRGDANVMRYIVFKFKFQQQTKGRVNWGRRNAIWNITHTIHKYINNGNGNGKTKTFTEIEIEERKKKK